MAYGAGAYGAHPYAGTQTLTDETTVYVLPLWRHNTTGEKTEIAPPYLIDPAILPPTGSTGRIEAVFPAAATIQALHVVALLNDNTVRPADPTLPNDIYKVFGVALNAALVGEDCTVVLDGVIQAGTWTEGSVYLSADGIGSLDPTPPGAPAAIFDLDMGSATGPNTLLVRPQSPVLVV